MKKTLIFASTLGIALSAAPFAFADTTVDPCASGSFSVLCNASLAGAFGGILTAVFVIAILIALAWLIYGGVRWILSSGDKGKVDSARQHIISALIGLIIVFLAYFLINVITQLFFHENINQITNIPTINLSGADRSHNTNGYTCTNSNGCLCDGPNNPEHTCQCGQTCNNSAGAAGTSGTCSGTPSTTCP